MCALIYHCSFKYALLPHLGGSPLEGGVIEAASAFNSPLISTSLPVQSNEPAAPTATVVTVPMAHRTVSFPGLFSTSGCSGIVIDVMKLAEDASGDVVLR